MSVKDERDCTDCKYHQRTIARDFAMGCNLYGLYYVDTQTAKVCKQFKLRHPQPHLTNTTQEECCKMDIEKIKHRLDAFNRLRWANIEDEARRINGTPRKESKMKIFKNSWKKYKLVSVIVFSVWWVPTFCRFAYPWLVQLGEALDGSIVSCTGQTVTATGGSAAVIAVFCIIVAPLLMYLVKKVLTWLYSTM